MGGCCSSDNGQEAAFELTWCNTNNSSPVPPEKPPGKLFSGSRKPNTFNEGGPGAVDSAYNVEFMHKLENGSKVLILLATGMGLECTIRLESGGKELRLVLFHEKNVREIPLSTITKVMGTPAELRRVETAAELDSNCCAVLMSSGTCIILRWETAMENRAFIAEMSNILSSSRVKHE